MHNETLSNKWKILSCIGKVKEMHKFHNLWSDVVNCNTINSMKMNMSCFTDLQNTSNTAKSYIF